MTEQQRKPAGATGGAFPSAPLLLLAIFSLVLPYVGIAFGIWGIILLALAGPAAAEGWWLIAAGAACIVTDVLIDVVWAHPSLSLTTEPLLNRPAASLVGRIGIVAEPIVDGRGKVRLGDTLWVAEGPDLTQGTAVRITAARDVVLIVERQENTEG